MTRDINAHANTRVCFVCRLIFLFASQTRRRLISYGDGDGGVRGNNGRVREQNKRKRLPRHTPINGENQSVPVIAPEHAPRTFIVRVIPAGRCPRKITAPESPERDRGKQLPSTWRPKDNPRRTAGGTTTPPARAGVSIHTQKNPPFSIRPFFPPSRVYFSPHDVQKSYRFGT